MKLLETTKRNAGDMFPRANANFYLFKEKICKQQSKRSNFHPDVRICQHLQLSSEHIQRQCKENKQTL